MTPNERAWLEQFEAHFDETGIKSVSALNVRELIRLAKGHNCCNPADHPGDCACENCDEEAHRQEVEDAIERTELIGGLER